MSTGATRVRRGLAILLAVGALVALRLFVLQTYAVTSGSMQPTLEPGDRLIVLTARAGIERGDVVVFTPASGWGGDSDLVKRVVGLAGDRVACCTAGSLTVNGQAVPEPYLYPGDRASDTAFDIVVPRGRIWVLGDHRSASSDSRAHLGRPGGGMVALDDVAGRVLTRYWPMGRLGSLTPAPALQEAPIPSPSSGTSPR